MGLPIRIGAPLSSEIKRVERHFHLVVSVIDHVDGKEADDLVRIVPIALGRGVYPTVKIVPGSVLVIPCVETTHVQPGE